MLHEASNDPVEELVGDAMRRLAAVDSNARRFENIGPGEAYMDSRRALRQVLMAAWNEGWSQGYHARVRDESARDCALRELGQAQSTDTPDADRED